MKSKAYSFEIKNLVTQFVAAFDNVIIKRFNEKREPDEQITEPELFRIDVWIDRTFLYANLRSRFFTIYKNFTIDRWKRYKLIKNRELQILMEDNQIEETMANDANPDIVNALIYRQVWNQYTSTLNSTDKTIALFLLKGTITMPALEKAVGLKKSQIYIRLQKIENDIQDIMSKYVREV